MCGVGEDMKRIAILLAFAPFACHASFELLMVLDGTTKSVHRFDPVSGAYFGAFGAGWLNNPQCLVADKNTNTVWVYDDGGLNPDICFGFDYNTGARKFSFQVGGLLSAPVQMTQLANGNLIFAGNGFMNGYTTAGILVGSGSPISGMGGVTQGADGQIYVQDTVNKTLARISTNFSLLGASSATVFTNEGQAIAVANDIYVATRGSTVFRNSTTFSGWVQINASNFSQTRGLSRGHEDVVYISGLDTAGTAGLVQAWDTRASRFGPIFGTSVLKNPLGSAIVIAPEPSSMALLGLGMLLLARRRRSG